jgi:CRP-like cAMP-binding protein
MTSIDGRGQTMQIAGWPLVAAGRVKLLDIDPELSQDGYRSDGAHLLTVPAFRLARGALPSPGEDGSEPHLGLLLLSGLVMREVTVCGRPSAELLGPGDLIRPWAEDGVELLPRSVNWVVLEKALVADLGPAFASRVASSPEIVQALIERSISRAQSLGVERAIASHVRVDVRVLAFLWHLAERWGIVLPGAVRIDVPLTHSVLARMVGARRPTVTTALQRLIHLEYLRRDNGAFILTGDASNVAELESRSPNREFELPVDGDRASAGV